MTAPSPAFETVETDALRAFAASIYQAAGVPVDAAQLAADTLVQADLWGHQSHGVMRLSWYVDRLRSGVMSPTAAPELVVDAGAIAVIDGHDAMGQILADAARREAVERAKAHGIGAVAVRNSNHFGTAMYFTKAAAKAGCVAFLSTNASPAMAPWGGRQKLVGTNPWSWAAPAGRHPAMVLDIANTAVARGKIYLARQKGMSIPLGWALNAAGEETTDPIEALSGITMPMAGHKGYAISLMMDMLSGVLTGSGYGAQVTGPYQAEKPGRAGHMFIAINVEAFQPLAEFNARMESLIAEVKSSALAKGFDEILYPGEMEARNDRTNRANGIALPADTATDLRKLAQAYDREAMLPFVVR